jgi:hypothetical protein
VKDVHHARTRARDFGRNPHLPSKKEEEWTLQYRPHQKTNTSQAALQLEEHKKMMDTRRLNVLSGVAPKLEEELKFLEDRIVRG